MVASQRIGQLWVIRVDIAMSALLSAIPNTGHCHVGPRPCSCRALAPAADAASWRSICDATFRKSGRA
jgi:hypothetical protein